MKVSVELSLQITYYMLITFKIVPVNQNYAFYKCFGVISSKNRVLIYFSLIQLNVELVLAFNSYAGGNSYYFYYDYCLLYPVACLIILELATMNPSG